MFGLVLFQSSISQHLKHGMVSQQRETIHSQSKTYDLKMGWKRLLACVSVTAVFWLFSDCWLTSGHSCKISSKTIGKACCEIYQWDTFTQNFNFLLSVFSVYVALRNLNVSAFLKSIRAKGGYLLLLNYLSPEHFTAGLTWIFLSSRDWIFCN